LARNSADRSANQKLGQDATEVLENTESGSSDAASWYGMRHHPVTALATQVVPNALSTKAAQKLLYGVTATQKAVAARLRNNPQAAYSLGMSAPTAPIAGAQE
jgi:hypothetical protein